MTMFDPSTGVSSRLVRYVDLSPAEKSAVTFFRVNARKEFRFRRLRRDAVEDLLDAVLEYKQRCKELRMVSLSTNDLDLIGGMWRVN